MRDQKCEVGCFCWCHADGLGVSAVIYSYVPFFTLCPAAWDRSFQAWCAPSTQCRDLLACSTQWVPAAATRDQGHQADPPPTGTGPAEQELCWVRDFPDSAGAGLGGAGRKETSLFWFVSTVTLLLSLVLLFLVFLPCLNSFFACSHAVCVKATYLNGWGYQCPLVFSQ